MTIKTALIVGAGIAGPATAMALQRAGIDATIVERHRTDAGTTGAFLTLGSNGQDALAAIGAGDIVGELGFPTPATTLRSYTGKVLGDSAGTATTTGAPVSRTLRRADLYRVLNAEAVARGIAVEYGARLIDARSTGDRVTAEFADGSTRTADILIGCDGVHAVTRSIVDPAAAQATYAGLVGTGGYAPAGIAEPEDQLQPGSYQMIFGKQAFFGYAGAPDGQSWWFANLPRRSEPSRDELAAITDDRGRERLIEAFAGDAGPATRLISATADLAPASPMHTVGRLNRWHQGRMVLVGDAAHAPSPSSGQGASLAIEDAVVLAQCLRDHDRVEDAFARYEAVRRARVEPIVRQAARVNNNKAATGPARVLRDLVLPIILRRTAGSEQSRTVYDHHLDWESTVSQ